jgi:hypothetical protein
MKKIMFALFAMVGSVAAVNAQSSDTNAATTTTTSTTTSTTVAEQEGKTKIKSEELPEAVKKSLEATEFKGWLINTAYQDSKSGGYEVELKNGAETKTVKFDKDGKKVD